jgi:hypothetical protein
LVPLSLAALALILLAIIVWFVATVPCGWRFSDGSRGRCDQGTGIVLPLATIPLIALGAALAFWRQRWGLFFAGSLISFVVMCLTFLGSWGVP